MTDKAGLNYAERNSLIPLCDLEASGFKPEGLEVASLGAEIRAEKMKPEHFYYNPANCQTPYSYWRGAVLLDLPGLVGKVGDVKAMAERLEGDINESVARRDFDRLLDLVDPRLAPEVFMEVFGNIPDQDKFRLFERLWRFNQHAPDIFPPDFARQAYQYRVATGNRLPLDSAGYVQVFISLAAGQEPQRLENWTTSINQALMAACTIPAAPVYRGQVHSEHINAYDGDRLAGMIFVKPGMVENIHSMNLIDLANFEAELNQAGIIAQYRRLSRQIDNDWFHKPEGIHAVSHTRRVLLLSLLLAYLERFIPADRNLLAQAAIYHDIGRVDDGYDPGHGQASYARTCRERLVQWHNEEENEIFRFIVENHDLPDKKAHQRAERYQLGEMDRTLLLYNIFKDADGLDRVRLGDLNPDYLRTASAQRLLLVAHQIYSHPDWLERQLPR